MLPEAERDGGSEVLAGAQALGCAVFPGGVGTAEEILYLLGILLREENAELPFPLILTGPVASAPYFSASTS